MRYFTTKKSKENVIFSSEETAPFVLTLQGNRPETKPDTKWLFVSLQ